MNKKLAQSVAVMVGYVIGVGMFGLPYLTMKSGIASFLLLIIGFGLLQIMFQLIYANLMLETGKLHRIVGYAEMFLGKKWKTVSFAAAAIGSYGALLAYIVITGIFINQLLGPILGGSEFLYASVLFVLQALIIFFGIGVIARFELLMTGLLIFTVFIVAVKGFSHIDLANYALIDWRYLFIPYGAALFSTDGNGAVPFVVQIVKGDRRLTKKALKLNFIISVSVIIAFTLVVLGISGASTTPDSLTGLKGVLGDGVITFSLIFGILTMITSFLGVAQSLREVFEWDYGIGRTASWALAVFLPYLMYIFGLSDLSGIISFAGAIASGASAVVLIMIFLKLKKEKTGKLILFKHKPSDLALYGLVAVFILGLIYEFWVFGR